MTHRDLNSRGPGRMYIGGPSDISMDTHRFHLLRALRRRRAERGQAILETAMVLPLLAVVVLIFVACGKAVFYYIDLTHAANEGAREAAVDLPNATTPLPGGATSLKTYICQQFGTGSELYKGSGTVSSAQVQISYPNGGSKAVGDPVTVDVSTHYSWFPFMNLGTFTIHGSATMRIEQDNTTLINSATGTCS